MIRNKVKVTPMDNKMRETRFRWFGHVRRRSEDAPMIRCEKIGLKEYRRGKGRLKKSWNKVIKHYLKSLRLTEDMTQDRNL